MNVKKYKTIVAQDMNNNVEIYYKGKLMGTIKDCELHSNPDYYKQNYIDIHVTPKEEEVIIRDIKCDQCGRTIYLNMNKRISEKHRKVFCGRICENKFLKEIGDS